MHRTENKEDFNKLTQQIQMGLEKKKVAREGRKSSYFQAPEKTVSKPPNYVDVELSPLKRKDPPSEESINVKKLRAESGAAGTVNQVRQSPVPGRQFVLEVMTASAEREKAGLRVTCPVCHQSQPEKFINIHLDRCTRLGAADSNSPGIRAKSSKTRKVRPAAVLTDSDEGDFESISQPGEFERVFPPRKNEIRKSVKPAIVEISVDPDDIIPPSPSQKTVNQSQNVTLATRSSPEDMFASSDEENQNDEKTERMTESAELVDALLDSNIESALEDALNNDTTSNTAERSVQPERETFHSSIDEPMIANRSKRPRKKRLELTVKPVVRQNKDDDLNLNSNQSSVESLPPLKRSTRRKKL